MDLLEGLNPKQKEAVLHREGPLLLLAGAGSGKTRVLTHRVAYLIENGVRPWNILAITFTNKAAKEMRERVNALVENGQDIWVSTFHSMCVRMLRRDIEKMGYDRNFSIYDSDDQERLVKECIKELNFDEKTFTPKSVLSSISNLKNELITSKQYEVTAGNDYRESRVAKIYIRYQEKLYSNNALDFDDLIFKTVEMFEKVPEVLEYYQEKFKYIMVDEYQDTNTAQYKLVYLLAEKYKNLCVVGDDDQSIYGWRGANIRNILDFENDFENTTTIKLEQNYRSTQTILNTANAVIKNNRGRKVKELWTENEKGSKVRLVTAPNHFEEGVFIAEEIRNKVRRKEANYNEFAILYRTNAQSRSIEEQLLRSNVPYRLLGGVRFYDRKEIKDIMSYLKIINNEVDDLAIKRVINVPKRGIGETTINKVNQYAYENDMDFFKVLVQADEIGEFGRSAGKLKEFAVLIGALRYDAQEMSVDELINSVLDRTGYKKELELENTPEAESRIENLKELISKAAEYQKSAEEPSLAGFLEEVALVADIDNYEAGVDSVVLMTLHSAKGLEFPYVFMAGMEEGIFPSYRSTLSGEESAIEEERRLCYVGITRAKKQLYLISAKSRILNGSTQYNLPSRFLKEIPEEYLDDGKKEDALSKIIAEQKGIEKRSFNTIPKKSAYRPKFDNTKPYQSLVIDIPAPKSVVLDVEKGDRVKHKKFGEGIIQEIKPAGADYEVLVDFDKVGSKRLMFALAKLEKI